MKKHGYDINQESIHLNKIIKEVPFSADKVSKLMRTFGTINMGEEAEFHSQSEESDHCITDRSAKENAQMKPNGDMWKFAQIKNKYQISGYRNKKNRTKSHNHQKDEWNMLGDLKHMVDYVETKFDIPFAELIEKTYGKKELYEMFKKQKEEEKARKKKETQQKQKPPLEKESESDDLSEESEKKEEIEIGNAQ